MYYQLQVHGEEGLWLDEELLADPRRTQEESTHTATADPTTLPKLSLSVCKTITRLRKQTNRRDLKTVQRLLNQ